MAGFRLGGWVNVQRTVHGRGKLSEERKHRLEQLPGWTWTPHADLWERSFAALEHYLAQGRDANPPVAAIEDEIAVGQWVRVQRSSYARGRLAPDRVARLEQLPGWEWSANEAAWTRAYMLLQAYAKESGHASPPLSTTIDGIALGSWVDTQRQKHRRGQLRPERAQALSRLSGWRWRVRS